MKINKIELKNIKYFASGSEETPCYNADIFINNKKAFYVRNNGCGGSDNHDIHEPFTYKDLNDLEKYLIKQNGETFEPIDSWCHDELYNYVDQKKLKRDMSKKFICVNESKKELYAYAKKGNTNIQFQDHMTKHHPNDICLNFISFDDAWKLYDGVTS